MIIGKQNALLYFDENAAPFFAIFKKGNSNSAEYRNDNDEDAEYSVAEARAKYERCIDLLAPDDYTINISDKKAKLSGRRYVTTQLRIVADAATQTATAPLAGIGAISMEDVEAKAIKIADERFERLMEKQELKTAKEKLQEVERDLKEAQRNVTDPWNKLVGALAPHSEHIIAGLVGRQAPLAALRVSGATPDEIGTPDAEAQQVAEDFIQALAAAKPDDWKAILIKLTNLIKTAPGKFETALNFL